MNVLYCYIFVWKRSQVMSGIRKTYSLSSVERDHQSNERKTQSSAHESEETPLAFGICKELWSRWHLHCLDMTWHRNHIDTAVLSTEEAHRLHKRGWAGHRQWMKMEEKRRSETIAHGQNSAVPRERYYVIFSFKNRKDAIEWRSIFL